ncbi:SWIM zinc finger family protein [Halorarius halobius]|uniref:SWIM zinc finger family protein n=1 Tax=Halorarius halobius TaxID=2962671 RepID=UPI0020CE67C2|nr:SWIM zinc finger family protein [Halorarius halobius]
MQSNTDGDKKRAVEELDFDTRTSKRVAWESWEFTVIGPHQVEVTNASYGFLKDDHTYTVGVENRDGLAVPAECDCPADVHGDRDCKHKVALATVGGPTVLNAAVAVETPTAETSEAPDPVTGADKLRADGGCECDRDDFPCFDCFRAGRRDLPE